MLSHVCCLVFLLTVLFCRLVRSYTKLEVGPPKLHRFKNVLRININQIKCCCALIILLTRLVGCVRELFVSTELLTTRVVYGSPKTTNITALGAYYTVLSNYKPSVQPQTAVSMPHRRRKAINNSCMPHPACNTHTTYIFIHSNKYTCISFLNLNHRRRMRQDLALCRGIGCCSGRVKDGFLFEGTCIQCCRGQPRSIRSRSLRTVPDHPGHVRGR